MKAIEAIKQTENKTEEAKKRAPKREYDSEEEEDLKNKKIEESRKKVRAELLKFKKVQIGSVFEDLLEAESKPSALNLQREKYLRMKKMSKSVENEVRVVDTDNGEAEEV